LFSHRRKLMNRVSNAVKQKSPGSTKTVIVPCLTKSHGSHGNFSALGFRFSFCAVMNSFASSVM
jgi:hypothetical protein